MKPIVFLKAHIDGYTRKDGVVVAPHEDKRQAKAAKQKAWWENQKATMNPTAEEIARGDRMIEAGYSFDLLRQRKEDKEVAERTKQREVERDYAYRRAAGVSESAFASDFTKDEIASIQSYYTSGDRVGALAEGRNAAISAIERNLRASGIEIDHVSESQGGKSKSLYVKIGGDIVRVSDHELPMTPERQTNRENGLTGRWSREVVVSDWQNTSVDDYVAEIKGGEMTKSHPTILFFKSHVGPYLRGGKLVNVKGYQGRNAQAVAMPGQMSLFGGAASGKPLPPSPLNGKDAVANTSDLFDADEHGEMPPARSATREPQHTEPTRELIAEHEHLVDVLRSPSHEDDKVEAEKQAGELAELEREAAPAQDKPTEKPKEDPRVKEVGQRVTLSRVKQSKYIGLSGHVAGYIKSRDAVKIILDDGRTYEASPGNLDMNEDGVSGPGLSMITEAKEKSESAAKRRSEKREADRKEAEKQAKVAAKKAERVTSVMPGVPDADHKNILLAVQRGRREMPGSHVVVSHYGAPLNQVTQTPFKSAEAAEKYAEKRLASDKFKGTHGVFSPAGHQLMTKSAPVIFLRT